jgi:glycosidase
LLYQINTRNLLTELSESLGKTATLADISDEYLDAIAEAGFDWVWMLGVWQTGPVGEEIARTHPHLQPEFHAALSDFSVADVVSSPFSIREYKVHKDHGGTAALTKLRKRLARRGLRLMLDFVPNHTARDHAWVRKHPEYFIAGTDADRMANPENYCEVKSKSRTMTVAHGRDPYFPGWTDTLQLNYRHLGLQQAMQTELLAIAERCDAVRCDMAMLVLQDVFQKTWGDRANPTDGSPPCETEFWPAAIAAVKSLHPEFRFMAEVYWDLEFTLQQQGFDFTYDKRLYDRLKWSSAGEIRAHLRADAEFQRRSVRFLENHDESRAAAAFPQSQHFAAACIAFFAPGLRFFYDGQLEGRRNRAVIQLRRRESEQPDPVIRNFYDRLLAILQRTELHLGEFRLLDCSNEWEQNPTADQFVVLAWETSQHRLLVCVNYAANSGQCFVQLPESWLTGNTVGFHDLFGTADYDRSAAELRGRGLYLDLPAWGYHAFVVEPGMPQR